MQITLNGLNAVVCGASQGIGKAIATQFAASGASVVLVARNESKLQETLSALDNENGQQHSYLVSDFSDPVALKRSIDNLITGLEKTIHILVNNTGGPPPGPIHACTADQLQVAFDMHLKAAHLWVQAVLPGMKEASYGRILNVTSTTIKEPILNLGLSNVIRAAVGNWAKSLANELATDGITVNNILPGTTSTSRMDQLIAAGAEKAGISVEESKTNWMNTIPAGRFASPEEIAAAATFLASPQAGYINGINLPVDGGRTKSL